MGGGPASFRRRKKTHSSPTTTSKPHSGLDAVRSCARVFLEAYTSILTVGTDRLEALYGKPVTVADRETVESVRFDFFHFFLFVLLAWMDRHDTHTHTILILSISHTHRMRT
jgi:hypothetical protein